MSSQTRRWMSTCDGDLQLTLDAFRISATLVSRLILNTQNPASFEPSDSRITECEVSDIAFGFVGEYDRSSETDSAARWLVCSKFMDSMCRSHAYRPITVGIAMLISGHNGPLFCYASKIPNIHLPDLQGEAFVVWLPSAPTHISEKLRIMPGRTHITDYATRKLSSCIHAIEMWTIGEKSRYMTILYSPGNAFLKR